jgi:Rrf2 family nitric oxide-sensitive transcriptional repressor
MRLTKSTDLALRAIMRLAVTGAEPCTARQIAGEMRVQYSHLAKVAARLRHLGLIETRRGRGGGLVLTETGRTASVGQLVRELEGAGEVVDCEGETPCPLRQGCQLRMALRRAQEAFFSSLDPLTVTDLVGSPTGPVLLGLVGRDPGAVR